jgi:SAM-dependent methyltransferase
MRPSHPPVSKDVVLAAYEEWSRQPEEHRKMMSSRETWENRFDEAIAIIPWDGVRRWLDVGCGTARFFEKVLASGCAPSLEAVTGVDAIANNVQAARAKAWPSSPVVTVRQWDIEDLHRLDDDPFDLVTMVGVVYQCGLAPAIAVEKCLGCLGATGTLLITTENPQCRHFREHPHGCYPDRGEMERLLVRTGRPPARLIVQYTNPLWRQREIGIAHDASVEFKEMFFLASYAAAAAV